MPEIPEVNKNRLSLNKQSSKQIEQKLPLKKLSKYQKAKTQFQEQYNVYPYDCDECEYGKHLCSKIKDCIKKPSISWKTIYGRSFNAEREDMNQMKNKGKNYSIKKRITMPIAKEIASQYVQKQSEYHGEFKQKAKQQRDDRNQLKESEKDDSNPQKNHKSLSKEQGYFHKMTTYNQNYIGHHGLNQYIRIKQKQFKEGLHFHGKSMYQTEFSCNFNKNRVVQGNRIEQGSKHRIEQGSKNRIEQGNSNQSRRRIKSQNSQLIKNINKMTCQTSYGSFFPEQVKHNNAEAEKNEETSKTQFKINQINRNTYNTPADKALIHQIHTEKKNQIQMKSNYQNQFFVKPIKPNCRNMHKIAFLKAIKKGLMDYQLENSCQDK